MNTTAAAMAPVAPPRTKRGEGQTATASGWQHLKHTRFDWFVWVLSRNLRFAFRLRTSIPPSASARDHFLHLMPSQSPGRARLGRLRGPKNRDFSPFEAIFQKHLPQLPYVVQINFASLPGTSGSMALERIQKEIAAAATGGILARRRESKMEIPVQGVSGEAAVARKQGG